MFIVSRRDLAEVTFNGNGDPPQLTTNLPLMREIRVVTKDPQLPVDILLLTVETCGFLACYKELKDPYRCYFDGLGYVYFEDVNESQEEKVKVALLRCNKGGIGPGGSLISIKNAVTVLRPKAVISVGTCTGLNSKKTKLGDVAVSGKLTTYASKVVTSNGEQSTGMRSYVSKRFLDVIKHCADGWQAPLKNPEAREVEVHCGEFLSGPDLDITKWRSKQLARLHPQAIAMEMEGEGIFTAAFDSHIEWLIVKGINDCADGTSLFGESWSPCASVMAASLVTHILSDPGVFRSWPHYEDVSAQSSVGKSKKKSPSPSTHDPEGNKHGGAAPRPLDLRRCQARLQTFYSTMSQVRITPWNPDDTVHIDELYTNLSWVRDHRTPRGTRKVKLADISELFDDKKPDERFPWRLPKRKRILVYGKPGIGKSTFSQKIAYDWAAGRKEFLKKFNVLLMIKLRDVCGLQDFGAVLRASKLLAADDTISVDSLHDYISQNQEQVLLVLDGYDEYSTGVSSPVDQIWEKNILENCSVIMTTRPSEADKVRKSSDVQLQIRGFDSEEQVKEFANKFLTDPGEVEMLVCYLRREKIWDLAEIPLLLLMMCLVWRDRRHRGLPKSRLELYERFVESLLYQMAVKDSGKGIESNIIERYKEELTRIGKLALDALLQGTLYFPLRQLDITALSQTMIRAGLFQISKLSSAVPDEIVFFLHKSIQEFLAAWFIMHEAGLKDGKTGCLSIISSLDEVSKVEEILTFMCQWSEEGAKAVFSLLQLIGEKQGLTKYSFSEVPAIEDMLDDQKKFCIMCLDYFQSCSVSHRQALYPSFINCVHGVVVVGYNQRSSIASEHLLKASNAPKPDTLVFEYEYGERVDNNMFSIMRDLETVVATCSGDTKPVNEYLELYVNDIFLKKEGEQIALHLTRIHKDYPPVLPVKLLRELTSTPESPHQKPADHVSQNQGASTLHWTEKTYDQPRKHSLSFVREIIVRNPTSEELTLVRNVLAFVNRPRVVEITAIVYSCKRKCYDAQLIESLVSHISFTDNLVRLVFLHINLTAKCAAEIARSLHQAPNLHKLILSESISSSGVRDVAENIQYIRHLSELRLRDFHLGDQECQLLATLLKHVVNLQVLDLSRNLLGQGITKLAKHLHSVPRLTELYLHRTQMGEEEGIAIARSLQNVCHLRKLMFSSNPLGKGVTELGKHLHHVPHLKELYLEDTQMGKEEVTAVALALKHVPELVTLDVSFNPLGRGVSELIQHLSGIPRLWHAHLRLNGVQMTKREASELAERQCRRSTCLWTDYHGYTGRLRTKGELSWKGVKFDDE